MQFAMECLMTREQFHMYVAPLTPFREGTQALQHWNSYIHTRFPASAKFPRIAIADSTRQKIQAWTTAGKKAKTGPTPSTATSRANPWTAKPTAVTTPAKASASSATTGSTTSTAATNSGTMTTTTSSPGSTVVPWTRPAQHPELSRISAKNKALSERLSSMETLVKAIADKLLTNDAPNASDAMETDTTSSTANRGAKAARLEDQLDV